jgi:hypothetical protein
MNQEPGSVPAGQGFRKFWALHVPGRVRPALGFVLCCVLLACSVGGGQTRSASKVSAPLIAPGLIEEHGLAFLTPTARYDREEDKHALALVFASTLSELRPAVRVVPLAQTLGAVNRAGLLRQYQKMYESYAATGVLERDTLAKLRGVTGARYFCLLQLGEFTQPATATSGAITLPGRGAPAAHIRLFVQIWDSVEGTIAWEGINEVSYGAEPGNGRGATFSSVVERAARDLVAKLP